MSLRQPRILALSALALGFLCDQLFWGQSPGINFFLFVALLLAVGEWLSLREGASLGFPSQALVLFVLVLAALSWVRDEPLTWFINTVSTLGALGLLAMSWLGGRWLHYSLLDHLWGWLRLSAGVLVKPLQALPPAFRSNSTAAEAQSVEAPAPAGPRTRVWLSVLLGLFLALPVVALLGALLAQADPLFGRALGDLLEAFNLEALAEYTRRLIFILIVAYLLAGAYLFALLHSRDERLLGLEQPLLGLEQTVPGAFLGWIEAVTVLASVDLLFASFVAFQFRYFFGGQANIRLDGFTYAEYARRGFGELVAVATLSLLLFLALSAASNSPSSPRRASPATRRLFSALGLGLLALVAVMLVSAFQRLTLYEAAYGFTRLRTYTHVFMVWLGLLLAAAVALELANRLRYIALAGIVFCLGFLLTLNFMSVDAFIVRQNVARQVLRTAGGDTELDTGYLVSLSDDAVPLLFDILGDEKLPAELRDQTAQVLVCRTRLNPSEPAADWRGWRLAPARAANSYTVHAGLLAGYRLRYAGDAWQVSAAGEWQNCQLTRRVD